MGYTHYFSQKRNLNSAEWKALCEAVEALLKSKHDEIPTRFECDSTDKPLIDGDAIRFNGVDYDGHETFMLTRTKRAKHDYEDQSEYDKDGAFDFCKTAHKPYDILVTASLLAAQHITKGAWGVGSDGESDDWQEGLALVKQVLDIDATKELAKIVD